mmetsp:Transcript_58067/g.163975  ORF Transcript_58067/g.163975 Transcript_58067/m.163975 type:complete len:202 (-) Transcript_58067:416-1021(-)
MSSTAMPPARAPCSCTLRWDAAIRATSTVDAATSAKAPPAAGTPLSQWRPPAAALPKSSYPTMISSFHWQQPSLTPACVGQQDPVRPSSVQAEWAEHSPVSCSVHDGCAGGITGAGTSMLAAWGRVAIQCREFVSEFPLPAKFIVPNASLPSALRHACAPVGSRTACSMHIGQLHPRLQSGSLRHCVRYAEKSAATQSMPK